MKPILQFNTPLLNVANLATSLQSEILDISECGGIAVHTVITGAALNGTLEVKAGNTSNATDFVTVATHAITTSTNLLDILSGAYYTKIIVKYTRVAGTGTITCTTSGKSI